MTLYSLPYNFWTDKFPYWTVFIAFAIAIGIIFILRGRKLSGEVKSQKQIFYGYSMFFFSYAVTRILFLFSDLENLHNNESSYEIFVLAGYMLSIVAMTFLVATIETYMVRGTKKVFTIISIIGFAFTLILFIMAFNNANIITLGRAVAYSCATLTSALVFFLYLYLIIKTSGMLRRNITFSFIGLTIMVVGIVLEINIIVYSGVIPVQISPLVMIGGIALFAFGQKQL